PGFEALSAAGRQRGADLQLVALVCPAGRSPITIAKSSPAGRCCCRRLPENPARRPHHAVGEQHAWRAANGAAGLSAHRPVLCKLARKSGAVGCSAALVSHPKPGTAKISARPATDPARTPAAGLTPPARVAHPDPNCRRVWSQLPDLGLSH